jgi:serine phosphatase RsbU (regulator of sigma subunit)/Tfp pilus assembly protein PilF
VKSCFTYLGLIAVILLTTVLSAKGDQAAIIDSLKIELSKTSAGKEKVIILIKMSAALGYNDPDLALSYAQRALSIAKGAKDEVGIMNSHLECGGSYYIKGVYDKAIRHFLDALKLAEKRKDFIKIVAAENSLGLVYQSKDEHQKSVDHFKSALEISVKAGDSLEVSRMANNLGNTYHRMKDYDLALAYHLRSLKIREKTDRKGAISDCLNDIGTDYLAMGKTDLALDHFERCLAIKTEMGDKEGMSFSNGNLGVLYASLKDYDKGLAHLETCLALAKEIGAKDIQRETYEFLARIGAERNDFKSAYENLQQFNVIKDSMFNELKSEQIAEMETKYDTEKKELENTTLKAKEKLLTAEGKAKDEKLDKEAAQKNLLYGGLGVLIIIVGFILYAYRNKRRANQIITKQKEEVEQQKDRIEEQHVILEEKNKEILDSITYAKRLQDAILPPEKLVKQHLPDSFILFKPKDIVSGDFYWLGEMPKVDDAVLFAAVDCTGHGVPGAMVSVVGANGLDRCVKEFNLTQPARILDKLTSIVEETFEKSESEVKDGMDMALCSLNVQSTELQYAGANNPIWIITQDSERHAEFSEAANGSTFRLTQDDPLAIVELKATKQPIGKYDKRQPFINHTIQLKKGDAVYIFSDGYADQFGGPRGKKFKYKQLKELLLSIQNKPMQEQQLILNQAIVEWMGELEQVDDICIIGVRV